MVIVLNSGSRDLGSSPGWVIVLYSWPGGGGVLPKKIG